MEENSKFEMKKMILVVLQFLLYSNHAGNGTVYFS